MAAWLASAISVPSSAFWQGRRTWLPMSDPDACDLTAVYACGLARNHGVSDGDKRTARVTARLFRADDGRRLRFDPADAVRTMETIAGGTLAQGVLATWFGNAWRTGPQAKARPGASRSRDARLPRTRALGVWPISGARNRGVTHSAGALAPSASATCRASSWRVRHRLLHVSMTVGATGNTGQHAVADRMTRAARL